MPARTNKIKLSNFENFKYRKNEHTELKTLNKYKKQKNKTTQKKTFLLNEIEFDLFNKQERKQVEHNNGKNILINANINRFDNFIFSILDLLNPFIKNHPKCEEKVIKFSELLIKTNKRYFSKAK